MCSPRRSKINAVTSLVAKSEGKRQLEISRRRCRDNTKMVLKGLGCELTKRSRIRFRIGLF